MKRLYGSALSLACLTVVLLISQPDAHAISTADINVCFKDDQPAKRVAACSRAITRGGLSSQELTQIYVQRAYSYRALAQYQNALDDSTAAIKRNPRFAVAFRVRAQTYLELGQHGSAISDARAALKLDSRDKDTYFFLGSALLYSGQADEAIKVLTDGLERAPQTLLLEVRAIAWAEKGNLNRSLADFSSIIKSEPNSYRAWAGRCDTYRIAHELLKALADCNESLRVNPNFPTGFENRARVMFELGDINKALDGFGEALRLDPASFAAYAGRADVLRKMLAFDRAMADLDRAINLNPKLAESYVTRGLIHEARGEIDQARAAFKSAIALPASSSSFQGTGGWIITDSGEQQKVAHARLVVLGEGSVPSGTLYASGSVQAQRTGTQERRIALVIGNGAYVSARKLRNPVNDARLISQNLRAINFQVSEGVDLDRKGMERALADFLRAATTADVAVLFYAGHGVQIDGQNYLLPIDGKVETKLLMGELMSLDTILSGLDDRLRANIIILDACRDNPMRDDTSVVVGEIAAAKSGLASTANLGKGATSGAGTLLAFSTAPGKVSLDGDGVNSPFSLALGRYLNVSGLEIQQVLTRVRAEVVATTKSEQVPWSNSSLLGEIYLAGRP